MVERSLLNVFALDVFIRETKLLRVAVVLLVFVSQLSEIFAGTSLLSDEFLGTSTWETGTGDTALVPSEIFGSDGVLTSTDWTTGDLSELGLRKDSLDYCDTTVTFGGTTFCLGFFIPELGIIPRYCTICATGKQTRQLSFESRSVG